MALKKWAPLALSLGTLGVVAGLTLGPALVADEPAPKPTVELVQPAAVVEPSVTPSPSETPTPKPTPTATKAKAPAKKKAAAVVSKESAPQEDTVTQTQNEPEPQPEPKPSIAPDDPIRLVVPPGDPASGPDGMLPTGPPEDSN